MILHCMRWKGYPHSVVALATSPPGCPSFEGWESNGRLPRSPSQELITLVRDKEHAQAKANSSLTGSWSLQLLLLVSLYSWFLPLYHPELFALRGSCPSQGANTRYTRAYICTRSRARVGSEHHVNIIFSPAQSISWHGYHSMACRRRKTLSSDRRLSERASALHRSDTARLITEKHRLDTKPLYRGCPACCLPVSRLENFQSYKP